GLAHVGLDGRRLRRDVLHAGELHHPPGLHLTELHQHLLGVLQQGALKEAQPEVLFEALHDDDVLPIHRVGGFTPLTLLLHRKAGEHPPHLRDLRLPPLSIRHLHASTSSSSLRSFIALGSVGTTESRFSYVVSVGRRQVSPDLLYGWSGERLERQSVIDSLEAFTCK